MKLTKLLTLALALAFTACGTEEDTTTAGTEVTSGTMTAGTEVTGGTMTAGTMTAGTEVTGGTMTAGTMTAGTDITGGVMTAGTMTAGTDMVVVPEPPMIPTVPMIDCTGASVEAPCAVSVQQARSVEMIPADTVVSLEGVISATRLNEEGATSHIVVQADGGGALSGIWIYVNDARVELPMLAEGQRVSLTALTADRFGQRQLQKIEALTVLGQEVAPAPLLVNPADIATSGMYGSYLEGVLVAVEGVEVSEVNPMPGTADVDPNMEFVVTGGLRVNDYLTEFPTPLALPNVGDRFSRVVGVLRFGNDDYKIEPRYAADLAR